MFDPSYDSAMQQMGFGHTPNCGKCGKAMTPENAKYRPELFLHDACLPDELQASSAPEEPLIPFVGMIVDPVDEIRHLKEDLERTRHHLYDLANHVRNTEALSPIAWGLESIKRLERLCRDDPDRYFREVVNR